MAKSKVDIIIQGKKPYTIGDLYHYKDDIREFTIMLTSSVVESGDIAGVVVGYVKGDHPLGEWKKTWNISAFKWFNGSITLEQ